MDKRENEQSSQDQLTQRDGKTFWEDLQKMPYDTSMVGKTFITFSRKPLIGMKNSDEDDQEKPQQP